MDVLIKNGDMVVDSGFNPLYTEGAEEVLQRVTFALSTPKGSFVYNRSLGVEPFEGELSEKGLRKLEARCREAVMSIEGTELTLLSAQRLENGRIKILAEIKIEGGTYIKEVTV